MTFRKSSIVISSDLKLSKALKSSKSNNPTQKVRKSLKSSKNSVKHKTMLENNEQERGKSGVTPFIPTLPANLFRCLILCFKGFKRHVSDLGFINVGYDGFMLLVGVASFGGVGCSVTGLTMLLYYSDNGKSLDSVRMMLYRFVKYGLVDKVGTRYYVSSHAEKLFKDFFTADDVRSIGLVFKDAKRFDKEIEDRKKLAIRDKYINDDSL